MSRCRRAEVLTFTAPQFVIDGLELALINSQPLMTGHTPSRKDALAPFRAFPFSNALHILDAEIGQRENAEVAIPNDVRHRNGGDDDSEEYFHSVTQVDLDRKAAGASFFI